MPGAGLLKGAPGLRSCSGCGPRFPVWHAASLHPKPTGRYRAFRFITEPGIRQVLRGLGTAPGFRGHAHEMRKTEGPRCHGTDFRGAVSVRTPSRACPTRGEAATSQTVFHAPAASMRLAIPKENRTGHTQGKSEAGHPLLSRGRYWRQALRRSTDSPACKAFFHRIRLLPPVPFLRYGSFRRPLFTVRRAAQAVCRIQESRVHAPARQSLFGVCLSYVFTLWHIGPERTGMNSGHGTGENGASPVPRYGKEGAELKDCAGL